MKKLVSLLLIIITAATLSVTASADAIAPEFDVIEIPTAVIEEENETDIIMEIQSEMLVEPEK
ncbi:MAG: hypothetical protein IJB86_06105 [Clostridia bacterium]|nr:hypothetical protein [Clostridia bacterium]